MPKEWKESYLVPLPKSGDLSKCSRWRGILLSSIPGKVFARILNARLNAYVEANDILPESQCGFRAGRSTMDMNFLYPDGYGSCVVKTGIVFLPVYRPG